MFRRLIVPVVLACLLLMGCGGEPGPSLVRVEMTGADLTDVSLVISPRDLGIDVGTVCSADTSQSWCAFDEQSALHVAQWEVSFSQTPYAAYIRNASTDDKDVQLRIYFNGQLKYDTTISIDAETETRATWIYHSNTVTPPSGE